MKMRGLGDKSENQNIAPKLFHSPIVTSDLALIRKFRDHDAAETLGRAETEARFRR